MITRVRLCAGLVLAGVVLMPGLVQAQSTRLRLDQRCQPIRTQQPDRSANQAELAYRQQLLTPADSFWLWMGRFGDGAALFCLTDGPKQGGVPLALPQLQFQYISEIRPGAEPNALLITVRHGNGRHAPMSLYRLRFSSRTQFSLTPLRRWQD